MPLFHLELRANLSGVHSVSWPADRGWTIDVKDPSGDSVREGITVTAADGETELEGSRVHGRFFF